MAIWLARLAVDRWRHNAGGSADAEPVVLIAETAHGPRIEAANHAGLAAGARPGMRLADARALCPGLKTAPSDPQGDRAFLEALALWAQRWGPWSALDGPDALLVDVSAVGHLFGGEARLLADAQAAFARRGLTARLAIAPTAGAAWALAHFGPERAILPSPSYLLGGVADHEIQGGVRGSGLLRFARSDEGMMDALADLPVAALRLDDDVLTVLRRLGLKRLGQLYRIGRDALHRRFRSRSPEANPLLRLDQLLGRVGEPLLPVIAVPDPWVQRRLMEPIRHRPLLDQALADLVADMVSELEGKALGARRLELGLWRVDGEVIVRRLEFAAATRDPAHVARLFSGKLDDVDAGFGIELLRLRASWTEPLALAQGDFEAAADGQGTSLAQCLDRLTVRLGEKAVRRPVIHASHIPERAQRWQSPLAPEPPGHGQLAFHQRPLKLLDRAELIAVLYATPDGFPRRFRWRGQVHEVARVEGPERIAPEWWREKSTVRLRDYYRIEDGEGRRYWIYRHGLEGDGRGGAPDWFLQGLCA
jgi:protein ImuB